MFGSNNIENMKMKRHVQIKKNLLVHAVFQQNIKFFAEQVIYQLILKNPLEKPSQILSGNTYKSETYYHNRFNYIDHYFFFRSITDRHYHS